MTYLFHICPLPNVSYILALNNFIIKNTPFSSTTYLIRFDIVSDIKTIGLDGISKNAHDYWSRFESLCRIVDKGDKVLNVPIYNGGLFQTSPNEFLQKNKLADPYFAEAIESLTIDHETDSDQGITSFIDYSSLGVRHLGDIYEGLLEFHVRIAKYDIVESREKGKSIWKNKSEIKGNQKN